MIRTALSDFADRINIPARRRSGPMTLTPNRVKIEILAGLTVALALVPEAVAFAFVAGVHPLVGLYAAFIVGPLSKHRCVTAARATTRRATPRSRRAAR